MIKNGSISVFVNSTSNNLFSFQLDPENMLIKEHKN